MNLLLVILMVCVAVYYSVSWFVPKVLAWLFKRKFHVKLTIGRIAVPRFILKDVNLSKNGYSIHIDEISFRSSFFNSEINKLLSVIVRDVRIDNSVEEKRSVVVENILKPLLSKQNSKTGIATNEGGAKNGNGELKKLLDFREKKLPPSLLMFAQFMAVHVYNISVMVLRGAVPGEQDDEEGWLLHANASELHVDGGAGGASRALLVSAVIVDASAKLLPRRKHLCLGELSCGMLLEGTLKASGPLSIEKVHTTISNPTISVHEALYSFIQERRINKKQFSPVPHIGQDRMKDIVPRISPIIPKIFSLKIDTTTLMGVRYNNVTDYQASLQSMQINSRFSAIPTSPSATMHNEASEKTTLPQVYIAFQLDQLKLTTNKEKLLFLNKLKLDAKLEKGVLNLYLIMSVLSVTYNHEDVHAWYYKHFLKGVDSDVAVELKRKPVPPWVRRVFNSCVVQGCAELRGVSLHARLRTPDALALGCGGFKIKLDQHRDTRNGNYASTLPRLLLASRHWSTELLVDSGWLAVGPHSLTISEPPHKKHHVWGNTLFLGVALVKWGSHGAINSKVEAMMDCLRIEWSQAVGNSLISALNCIQDYNTLKKVPKRLSQEQMRSDSAVAVNATMSHMNVFSIIDETMCLMTRIDAISLDKSASKSSAVISGLKVVDMIPYRGGWACQRAEEILITFFHLKLARIEYVPSSVDNNYALLEIQFKENVDIEWSANLHLKIMAFVRAFKDFQGDALRAIKGDEPEKTQVPKTERKINWCMTFKGESTLGLILSAENNLCFNFDELSISRDNVNGLSVVWSQLKTTLNGADVVYVDGFVTERILEDSNIRIERIANENFILDWNQVWGVTIDSMRVVFPYKHRFAESIQGEFVSLFKWLKIIHNIKRKPFTSESPLPSDLQINIEEFIVEMSDDPFEVKLRDNYELLEDEYKESQKRRAMLDAKLQELCKPHLFLPARKVEELSAALCHKDAQIYVQRHRAAAAPRTRLVACALNRLHILALADPIFHGTANATRHIRDIDFESPWPEEGIEFTTLWCRAVSARCGEWQLLLRDFPQPLLSMKELKLWGTVAGAEQVAPPRAYRNVTIERGEPWGEFTFERSMMPLKLFYDLCCEMTTFSYSFGPCWEPVIAQCNISFEQVSRPSLDPSLPLAWWDKARLLMHGRLTAKFNRMTCLLHVSLDPYNTTEEMELTWTDLVLDWTNGKLVFRGDLNVFVRTASKYDDCRLLHLPGLKLAVKMCWQCAADPRDHHAVAPCAPDKLPEYSSNQEHDSFRAFRSQALDLHISLDTKPSDMYGPVLLVYGSTLRWFESLKLILSGVTRPTRRGAVFHNVRPRRPQLSRHYRAVSTSLTLHNLQVYYWSSSSMQRGIELLGVRLTCGSEHALSLVPTNDGLVRRPRANWSTVYMNCDLNDAEMWLKSATSAIDSEATENADSDTSSVSLNTPVEKCYCLSVGRVSYGREAAAAAPGPPAPAHRLAVHDLRGAWTKINRDVAFALFDTYIKTKQLKKNLSTKALKEEDKPATSPKHQREIDVVSPPPAGLQGASPGGGAEGMLAQLVAEAGADPPVVFSDDLSGQEAASNPPERPSQYHPPKYWLDDDTAHTTWLIELVNSQVLLKGCETRGYVILCAARAEVRQRVRRAPAATAWSGAFTCMQYYATVSAGDPHELDENIQWVSVDEIEERSSGAHEISTLPDVPRLVGSGHSAGGVIGSTVGPSSDRSLTQLQRIVSRCACEFYYLSYDDETGGAGGAGGGSGVGWSHTPEPYDAFTLMHHDLDVCTNSLQYGMLLDVVNNLVLYVEPERRRTLERRARMRFQLQLHKDQDPRKPIQKLQNQVRESLARLRRLEKESYLKRRALTDTDKPAADELKNLDVQVNDCKEQVWALGEELDAMVRAWREVAAATRRPPAPRLQATHAAPHRLNEICFKSARWRLTDADGQLGIADLVLTNFLYTKTSRSDDSVEHQLELGYILVKNLLPREPFPEVLAPQAPGGRAPLARRAALRVFCRDRPPVGGISVKEHFEVNVVPIKIGLTKKFFNTMLKFCFPERDPESMEGAEADDDDTVSVKSASTTATLASTASKKPKKKSKDSNFYVKIEHKDDVEKMKERAEKNKLFIYIKIPEVPVRLSYKGSKEKNLEDVRDLPLVLPTMEYHNVTWTWLDLLLAAKSDIRRVIVSQAIRQKLQLHRRAAAAPEPQEEDKARLLLGDRTVSENKPQKKSVPSVFKFSKS